MNLPTCRTCKHWVPDEHDDPAISGETGLCRRYPPSLPGRDEDGTPWAFAAFPATYHDDGCGEHVAHADMAVFDGSDG